MIKISIPNWNNLNLENLVLDYNGTLAVDGRIERGVISLLNTLSENLRIHIITADTFSSAKSHLEGVSCQLTILDYLDQDIAKLNFIKKLGCDNVISIGNGRNDRFMLKNSVLGIAVILSEGLAVETMLSANIICKDIVSALELLLNPMRLIATLRS